MHNKIYVCSIETRRKYQVVERYPRLSWELPMYCILKLLGSVGWAPLTQWVALDEQDIAEFIEYHISEE